MGNFDTSRFTNIKRFWKAKNPVFKNKNLNQTIIFTIRVSLAQTYIEKLVNKVSGLALTRDLDHSSLNNFTQIQQI